ncbi:hypothetical protein OSTOST_15918, partial [Ostertagia ostertagi]
DLDESEETHCVYRHLNDELYRYCLLVHQKKDGDRCYYHEGHTICCCFVHPDKETCDPTEIDLIRPPPPSKLPSIRVTPRPNIGTSARTTTKIGGFTSFNSSTTNAPTSTTSTCRISYPRKKVNGSKARPVLVCDSAHSIALYFLFSVLFFHILSPSLF